MSEDASAELLRRSQELLSIMRSRRSARSFQQTPIPIEVIKNCIAIAASAPSGANTQPWSFVLVADPGLKKIIRKKAESIEKAFYSTRITEEWKAKLQPLKTRPEKTFLEEAPYLICIFTQIYGFDSQGRKVTHYYPMESVGIATGFLISALHLLGISTLTYTPAPLTFLRKLLGRPENERPYMILVVGYPSEDYIPPSLVKKREEDYLISRW